MATPIEEIDITRDTTLKRLFEICGPKTPIFLVNRDNKSFFSLRTYRGPQNVLERTISDIASLSGYENYHLIVGGWSLENPRD